jgi:hypothetical protein
MSAHIMVDLGACRSLPFSAFCFSFTNPGGRELREREKEKAADLLGLSDPAATCFQPMNRQVGLQELPDPALGCYVL